MDFSCPNDVDATFILPFRLRTQWAKSPKNSLKECVSVNSALCRKWSKIWYSTKKDAI